MPSVSGRCTLFPESGPWLLTVFFQGIVLWSTVFWKVLRLLSLCQTLGHSEVREQSCKCRNVYVKELKAELKEKSICEPWLWLFAGCDSLWDKWILGQWKSGPDILFHCHNLTTSPLTNVKLRSPKRKGKSRWLDCSGQEAGNQSWLLSFLHLSSSPCNLWPSFVYPLKILEIFLFLSSLLSPSFLIWNVQ